MRDVLAFADASDAGLARVAIAETIASRHDAHLQVEILDRPAECDAAANEVLFAGRPYGDVLEAVREAEHASITRVRSVLPRCDDLYSVQQREIAAAHVRAFVANAAHAADLVVLAKPEEGRSGRRDADILMGALIEGGAPCLALPNWIAPRHFGRRILIAWRPGPQAARAVRAAAPFLKKAERVRVCIANPHRGQGDAAALMRFENYLVRHGAHFETTSAIDSWEGPEPAFRAELEGFSADLLVMGAFHHAPLRETVFGGMTVNMLLEARCPVLLAH